MGAPLALARAPAKQISPIAGGQLRPARTVIRPLGFAEVSPRPQAKPSLTAPAGIGATEEVC